MSSILHVLLCAPLVKKISVAAQVAQDRALASQAESRDRKAAADQAKKAAAASAASFDRLAGRGGSNGRAGAEETKAGGGREEKAALSVGYQGSQDDVGSLLTDDELGYDDESNAGFYRASARAGSQLCSGHDACWWMGAEVLVADDLPTPAQKVVFFYF